MASSITLDQDTVADGHGHVVVTVHALSGDVIATLCMEPQDDLRRAKSLLQEQCGYPPEAQQLLYQGVLLEDGVSLESLSPPRLLTLVLREFDVAYGFNIAVGRNHAAAVRTMLSRLLRDDEERVEMLNRTQDGVTPLFAAANLGHVAVCHALLEAAPTQRVRNSILTWADILGRTALHLAAFSGHENACSLLLEAAPSLEVRGEMLEAANYRGQAALHYAAREGHEKVCRVLLGEAPSAQVRGKMRAATDTMGHKALHYAEEGGHESLCQLLLEEEEELQQLH